MGGEVFLATNALRNLAGAQTSRFFHFSSDLLVTPEYLRDTGNEIVRKDESQTDPSAVAAETACQSDVQVADYLWSPTVEAIEEPVSRLADEISEHFVKEPRS